MKFIFAYFMDNVLLKWEQFEGNAESIRTSWMKSFIDINEWGNLMKQQWTIIPFALIKACNKS